MPSGGRPEGLTFLLAVPGARSQLPQVSHISHSSLPCGISQHSHRAQLVALSKALEVEEHSGKGETVSEGMECERSSVFKD